MIAGTQLQSAKNAGTETKCLTYHTL